jgi:DNA-directed RNA polymerase specialized sigma24 family protein
MAQVKGRLTEPIPSHRVLREVYRHYVEFKEYVSATGKHVINHGYYIYEDDGETVKDQVSVSISFWDLHRGIENLSERKKEAFYYNVILDMKQKDVAKIMNITTVSVGQYVEAAMRQLAKTYFAEEPSDVPGESP